MEISRRCEICNVDVHRASDAKYVRGKKHLDTRKQEEVIIPQCFFKEEQAPVKKKSKKHTILNPENRQTEKI